MRFITDFHIHSKFSRACSKNLTLSNLAAWAQVKGIDLLGTSDFTHPGWMAEIEAKLEPAEPGFFRLKNAFQKEDGTDSYVAAPHTANAREVRFMLATEVSCIYKKNNRVRRLHLLILAPSIAAVKSINAALEKRECNVRADGRPILGLDAKDIVKIALEADPRCLVIPAHAWTPWFSVFGSESGFDSLEECFEELTPHIHAIETGLSSDPSMNWRLSKLDGIMLVSNSDAHGVRNLGREANVIEMRAPSYDEFHDIIATKDHSRFLNTIEFFPEEGKYHVDGHRACDFHCEPEETKRRGGICPKCGKPLTRGVLGRVFALADNEAGRRPKNASDYRSIVPLEELIGDTVGVGKASKKVFALYEQLLAGIGPEFTILLEADIADITKIAGPKIGEAVQRMRDGNLSIKPGYDGVFGEIHVFDKLKKNIPQQQLTL